MCVWVSVGNCVLVSPVFLCGQWRCGGCTGNYLNGGTSRGGAYGFRLETLVKAESIKGADNKTTLVDVLAVFATTAPGEHRAMLNLSAVCRNTPPLTTALPPHHNRVSFAVMWLKLNFAPGCGACWWITRHAATAVSKR